MRRGGSTGGVVFAAVVLAVSVVALVPPAGAETPPGSLDPTFGQGGVRRDDFGSTEVGRGVAVQPDGRIVVAGTGCGGDILVARYTAGGTPDPSFSDDGWTCVDVAGGSADEGEEVFVLGDGKLLVAGTSGGDFALVRLDARESPDPSFDGDGRATYDFGATERLNDAALAPDGKVVLVGSSERPGCQSLTFLPTVDAAIARVDAAGNLDPTFGTNGRVLVQTGTVVRAQAVVVQPDGAVVVGGNRASCSRLSIDNWLTRFTSTGAPDPTFTEPRPHFGFAGDTVVDIARQPDGKLVVAIDTFVGPGTFSIDDDAVNVLRVNPDGTLDPTFDGDGVATVLFGEGLNATARAVVVQGDGKIVVGATLTPRSSQGPGDFALVRFDANGTPDPSFGSGGKVVTDLGSDDRLYALALQPDGKLVAAGASGADLALARYLLAASGPSPTPTCVGQMPTIVGTPGNDTLTGTRGADVIAGLSGDDTVNGLGGNDTFCGGDGDDFIDGGRGNDTLLGNEGNDRLNGQAGDDQLEGGSGNDRLVGGTGMDSLAGDQGTDTLSAIDTPNAPDVLTGGPDGDRCFSDPTDTPPSVSGADC